MRGLITRDEKYALFGSKSGYFNLGVIDCNKVEEIVKSIVV